MTEKNHVDIVANDPILLTIFGVVKLVYQHYDPTNVPAENDGWQGLVYLSYETSKWDPLNPIEATLHLDEDKGERRRRHFQIDLVYPCIRDRFTHRQHRTPPDVLPLLGELKSYVNEALKFKRSAREAGYYRRLVKNELLPRKEFNSYRKNEPGSGWGGTCPACFDSQSGKGSELIACMICGTLGCANIKCHGHDINGIKQSANNPGETYCRPCNGGGGNAKLVPCTKCRSRWFNPRRHPQCVGRPGPPIVVHLSSGSRRWEKRSQKKSFQNPHSQHPPAIVPCDECWEEDHSRWLSCKGSSCWSLNGVICKACSPNGGVECAGGHTWLCDECANQLQSLKCCDNSQKDIGEQVERGLDAIYEVYGSFDLQDLDDSLNSEQFQTPS